MKRTWALFAFFLPAVAFFGVVSLHTQAHGFFKNVLSNPTVDELALKNGELARVPFSHLI